jgi:DNA-binding XRE family transcriptional regulator
MARKRIMTKQTVNGKRRVYRVVRVTKTILQCERPYVLFGEAIRDARLALGLTQEELAAKAGYVRASIANIELGRQRVLLDDVFVFAKALRLKPEKLFLASAR